MICYIEYICLYIIQDLIQTCSSFITDKNADVFPCSWGDIPITLRCDGTNNCGDNSDEENCNKGNKKRIISE